MTAFVSGSLFFAPAAQADQYDAQINALKAQIAQQQQTAAAARSQATTINSKVAELNAQIGAVQAQLALNRARQAQINQRMAEAQAELVAKRQVLDENIRAIYQQGKVTPIEMLASSKNFSEYVDKQQYNDKIKQHIQEAMEEVTALKADLERQTAELNVQISQAAGLNATLQAQRAEQRSLLAAAQANEAQANADIKAKDSQVAKLRAQQAAAIAAISRSYSGGNIPGASGGRGGACDNGHGNGGYPMKWCDAPQDSLVDNWGMYSRECVSWAAWRRSNMGRPIPGGWGNANQWDERARAAGFRVDNVPEVGAVAQTNVGYYGHVGIVEQVSGGTVYVSELNYDNAGHYRIGVYSAASFNYIH